MVFPSNDQLSVRAHGIAGTTLRRHLTALVDAGLIQRKDSANGKRYARKNETGAIEEAFGFSLAPLLARAEELAHAAQQVAAERKRFRITKEALSICRRDVRKLISAAMEEGAAGDWGRIEEHFLGLTGRIPARRPLRIYSQSSRKWRCCAKKSSTGWNFRRIPKVWTAMLFKMNVTYRIQIPNPAMNLNLALEKSRGRNRAKPSGRQKSR